VSINLEDFGKESMRWDKISIGQPGFPVFRGVEISRDAATDIREFLVEWRLKLFQRAGEIVGRFRGQAKFWLGKKFKDRFFIG